LKFLAIAAYLTGEFVVQKLGDKAGEAGVPGWRRKTASDSYEE